MVPRRFSSGNEPEETGTPLAASSEALRAAQTSSEKKTSQDEEKVSLFWRIFGGTILSMVALGALTLYNNLSANISDLRRELNQEREARSELVRKQDFTAWLNSQAERLRPLEAPKAGLEALKERSAASASAVEGVKKEQAAAVEELRKELAALRKESAQGSEASKRETAAAVEAVRKELQPSLDMLKKDVAAVEALRERITALETLKKEVALLEVLRERLTGLMAEQKTVREEMSRLQQEIERNKAADQERKALRDEQYKQIEQTLKELQKELQAVREKLARLEAAMGPPSSPAGPPSRPAPPPPSTGVETAAPASRPVRSVDGFSSWLPFRLNLPKK
ncbi:MAG: hypothetical protein N3E46_06780 [Gemmataceae bacterium]|nr:hypothetical protein [Gemmataceae bacterium]